MILVTGGRAEGKRRFADKQFAGMEICDGYQEIIRACLEKGEDPLKGAEALTLKKDLVILLDETGCGVVPAEKKEREYREAVGRTGCFLAEHADEVWRVVLGIGTRIK